MNTRQFKIRGLDCAEEISALRKTVGRLENVDRLDFDLLEGVLRVTAPPDSPSDEAIRMAVREAGLDVITPDTDSPHTATREKKGRLLMCAASGVFLLAGLLTHSLDHGGFLHALTADETGAACAFPLPSILFFCASMILGGWFVFPKAWISARHLRADMNLLMTLAVIGAIGIGQWLEAASVTFLFSLALLLEAWSVGRARHAIKKLLDLSPATARVVCPHDGDVEEKRIEAVAVGSIVLVRPGEKIPLDGTVTHGSTSVNQAPITGESIPVAKEIGDPVFAGTLNNDGAISFQTTKTAGDTTLARIIRMVEEAQTRRAKSEQWVEKFAHYYTPAMILIAILVAVIPPLAAGGHWVAWFYQGLVMLVIACPCALVISTPVSILAGLTAAAHAGVLIKGGIYLEIPARLRALAFDKTGTLTHGHPEVQQILPVDDHTPQGLLATAAALESMSDHPLARAVCRRAKANHLAVPQAVGFQSLKGRGAEAFIDGTRFWMGSHRFMHEKDLETPAIHDQAGALEDAGHSVIAIGNDRHVCGLISVADGVRPEAAAVVRELKQAGIDPVVLLTGDNEGTARAVAATAGVETFEAELLPEDKVRSMERLTARYGQVAMVGDGVNDAPAMAASSLGIAMGAAGADAAIETADVALMADDLRKLPWLIHHSRRSVGIIRQNIVFAVLTKLVFMALALTGRATLWMAIAADMGASLLVIFNALRLLRTEES